MNASANSPARPLEDLSLLAALATFVSITVFLASTLSF